MPVPDELPTLESAYRSAFRRRTYGVAFLGAIVLGAVSFELLQRQSQQFAAEQARLCAATLGEAPPGSLAEAVDQLRATHDRLVAVAIVDAIGGVQAAYPEDPAYRNVATAALQTPEQPILATAPVFGVAQPVGAVVTPIMAASDPVPRRVVVLLRVDSPLEPCLWGAGLGAIVLLVAHALAGLTMRSWFHRRILEPLRWMADPLRRVAASGAGEAAEGNADLGAACGGYRELAALRAQLHALSQDAALSAAHAARVERDSQWQLREREAGFDRQLRRAREQATIDPLTKLRNRAFLDRELDALVAAQKTRSEDLALVMIDVDHFKHHNDTQGHQAGDEVLAFIGELLRGATRPTDHAVRYGGDEFLLVLPGAGNRQAGEVVERIIRLFKQYTSTFGSERPPSMSAGVASLKGDGVESAADLLARADEALYRAKKLGKNAVAPCVV